MPALRLDQKEGVTTGKFPNIPVPWAFPRTLPSTASRGGGARAGPSSGGGGRAGGGRSRSKMAAQRRSLLQSVSGIFPPSVHTHPPGGCEGVPGPPPHPPPALPCGKGEVPPHWGGGLLLSRPLCRLRAGGLGLRGSLRGQRSAPWADRPLCGTRWATGGCGGRASAAGFGVPRCVRGQLASAGREGDGGPRDVSLIAGCSSRPQSLVLGE